MVKRMILVVTAAVFPVSVLAAAGERGPWWEEPQVTVDDRKSLQRGARLFANYCMGCHTAKYHRWMHVADDLGIPEDVVEENLIWTTGPDGDKHHAGSLMTNAMTEEYGSDVFGKQPPDLTLTARSRGPAWIYNYLRTFYIDESSPTGVDNAVLAGASMPHVLWRLQGWQRPVHDEHGGIESFERVEEGTMSPEEFDRAMNDLVNFLVYVGEPARMERTTIGGWVILFLLILLGVAYLLKSEYWKDVH